MKSHWLAAAAILVAAPLRAQSAMAMDHGDTATPKTPMLMPGYGSGGFKITTSVPQSQAFFDNGMQLAHAFAHKAAIEAMQEAVRLDPKCAMCVWGQAWASGPTINFTKTEDGGGGKDGDLHFAKAMAALANRYPQDDEIAVIAADAWLMTHADNAEDWKLNARMAMPLLEGVLKRDPDYTPAIHFYIHATEMAGVPALAEPYADRLAALAPRASHLVHMPSHTYYWVGRYEDAAKANMRAVELGIENAKRLNMPPPEGVWGLPYHSHNVTFGLGGAIEAGDADIALRLGRPLVAMAQAKAEGSPFMQMIAANGYYAMARFADPAEVLALPKPKLPYLQAAWHYARGEAFARRNNVEGVRAEAAAIHGLPGELGKDDGSAQAQTMTFIARNVLIGRAAMIEGRPREAALAFAQAAELQESDDFTSVSDPPAWGYPVRRYLAAALLAQGDRAGARRELDAALRYRPKDPGSLTMRRELEARTAAR